MQVPLPIAVLAGAAVVGGMIGLAPAMFPQPRGAIAAYGSTISGCSVTELSDQRGSRTVAVLPSPNEPKVEG